MKNPLLLRKTLRLASDDVKASVGLPSDGMAAADLIPDARLLCRCGRPGALQSGVDLFPDQLAESVEDNLGEICFQYRRPGATGLNQELECQKAVSSMF
jgi:hypothetical protein